ncbi:MAG: phospho-N-acetylmuramoyl-pentapeptide-transferase [Deltaproteobacteria bacterium]|nr:MAG: phospho-N-acetylmuramoyl-pentapeptide-transferase [Deltaproteobacteria bacterium]
MIYWLFYPLSDEVAVLNVLRYTSFRIVMGGLTALLFVLFFGPGIIRRLRLAQHGLDTIREDTPERHREKEGTPSMGGLMILAGAMLGTLLWADPRSRLVWSVVAVTLGYGAIGFYDDYMKFKNRSKGLSARAKLVLQFGVAAAVLYLFQSDLDFRAMDRFPFLGVGFALDTRVAFPFISTQLFYPDLGWLYLPFALFVIVGTSNAVNLTDGLDGLAIGPSIVAALTWGVLAYAAGTVIAGFNIAQYLYIPFIEGAAELTVFCASLAGAGIGFLWFNTYPASIFMGDVGSLAIGGALGMLAVLTKNELVSVIVHGVFLAEILSVILQVASFKSTGKRIFRMAPIHHHFELKGWAEPKIIVRFWILSILLALVAFAGLKLR